MASEVIIVGAGAMAIDYAKVLRALGVSARGCCRSTQTARAFEEATGLACVAGGVSALRGDGLAGGEAAIVAVPVDALPSVTGDLLELGIKRLLVEKPAGPEPGAVAALAEKCAAHAADVFVAYNRRFYASVRALRDRARRSGGIVSLDFEFTELSDRVAGLPNPPVVMENWGIANSTHVIDTAFFLAGMPARLSGLRAGGLAWHPAAARYAGHGWTKSDVLFSYRADWDAPGRWGIEANTREEKLVLRPMEKLAVQKRNAFSLEPVELDDDIDSRFKPGLYRQVEAFLGIADGADLLPIAEHAERLALIDREIFRAPKAG